MFFHKTKQEKHTKADRVKTLLLSSKNGVSNWDLNKITFRYGAVIFKLRNEGYKIETKKVKNSGLYIYTVKGKVK